MLFGKRKETKQKKSGTNNRNRKDDGKVRPEYFEMKVSSRKKIVKPGKQFMTDDDFD